MVVRSCLLRTSDHCDPILKHNNRVCRSAWLINCKYCDVFMANIEIQLSNPVIASITSTWHNKTAAYEYDYWLPRTVLAISRRQGCTAPHPPWESVRRKTYCASYQTVNYPVGGTDTLWDLTYTVLKGRQENFKTLGASPPLVLMSAASAGLQTAQVSACFPANNPNIHVSMCLPHL